MTKELECLEYLSAALKKANAAATNTEAGYDSAHAAYRAVYIAYIEWANAWTEACAATWPDQFSGKTRTAKARKSK